ncbi:Uncharacterised protein [Mycobacteroides abscessus subsp. abscessus]|nr:Uncharacterised protein [Mycobacteroides abscessus subsp. abscessus]
MAAAIAPGSQKWNGNSADLLSAPTSTSSTPATAIGPLGCFSRMTARLKVSAVRPSATMPESIARPPKVVTISAVSAAPRLALRVKSLPISR